jgi:N6-adenosine-specific RNA methylase IME4
MTPSLTNSLTTANSLLPFDGAEFSPTSLALPEGLPFERWEEVGVTLRQIERSAMFWIGDWVNFGERKYGETYAQAAEATDYEVKTLQNAAWVCSRIESSRRREDLTWGHHAEVASLPPGEQARWLREAANNSLSVMRLRDEVQRAKMLQAIPPSDRNGCTVNDLSTLIKHGAKFGTVYVDPPWQYGNQSTRAATDNHYPTMTVDEICALPVADLAADVSHLHLWTTNGFLFECPRIIEAWGFTYKSCFVWAKPQMGIGNYWRVSHEFLVLAVRGKSTFLDRGLMSWAEIERGEHSSKPDKVRRMIEKASPGPRLELFGRYVSEGWTVWGNEISRDLFFNEPEK